MTTTDRPRRRIPGIGAMLLAAVALVILSGYFFIWLPYEREQSTMARIEAAGGNYGIDEDWGYQSWWKQKLNSRLSKYLHRVVLVMLPSGDIDYALIEELGAFSQLEMLYADDRELSDSQMEQIGGLARLRLLSLQNARFSEAGMMQIRSLRNLEKLRLDGVPISDADLEALSCLPRLELLGVDSGRITDAGMLYFSGFQALTRLSLGTVNCTEVGFEYISRLKNLKYLPFTSKTPISDTSLKYLATMPNLELVEFDETTISPAGIEWFRTKRPDCMVEAQPEFR